MSRIQMLLRALPFTLVLIIPGAAALGLALGGLWTFLAPVIAFVAVPLLDVAAGISRSNPRPEEEPALARFWGFTAILALCVPVQYGLLVAALAQVQSGTWSALEWTGNIVSVGISGGAMGITVAHELVHRRSRWEKALGWMLLTPVWYTHWAVEHVSGHHRRVATPADPASARREESLYRFLPRTLLGTVAGAWRIEQERLARRQRPLFSPANRLLRGLAAQVTVTGVAFIVAGPLGGLFLLTHAVVAILLLEIVNYVEHYGLQRKASPDGGYERVTHRHSWNASQRVTNWLLFHLQRHSDHHAYPGRRYPILRHFDDSPQLPTGYAGMLLLALVPPLWFAVMAPRLPDASKELPGAE